MTVDAARRGGKTAAAVALVAALGVLVRLPMFRTAVLGASWSTTR